MIVGLKEVIKSMMPKFVWKSSYRIVPGLRKSEQVGDYFFQVKDNHETVVERIYETSSYDELHPNRKHEDEYAEETLSRLEVEIIHQIVLRRMIYQKVFSPVQIVPLGPPELLNKDELEKAGAEFKRIMSDWRQLEILFGDNYFSRFSP